MCRRIKEYEITALTPGVKHKESKSTVIFLDIDGVLNGGENLRALFWVICVRLHCTDFYRYLEDKFNWRDVYGIHEEKVKRLVKICKACNSNIVLTSSWRGTVWEIWNNRKDFIKMANYKVKRYDPFKLVHLLMKYDVNIEDSLPYYNNRETAIIDWIESNLNDRKFIILDDEFALYDYFLTEDNLILTSDSRANKPITGKWYNREGIRNCHVKKAIQILKGE